MEDTIKKIEKKVRILFICRIIMWLICAGGCFYWIVWSFKIYQMEEYQPFDVHTYATAFRPYFNLGITISLVSITISLILRLISDRFKRELKNILYEVRK